ncbi:DUF5687 family protein [Parabacteroides sp. Marseille-P3160]|uniref:DUF5687 family protein n=1 Tax=Parabacteroides sp. Marseille-P3160 TaxID=1917887 RepID=UPI0009BBDC7F|nr:DUF5687 family protein [Parabacteroides sp. Marseille-P3160]
MLLLDLLKQDGKKAIRSQAFYKNLAVNIMLGFFGLYMAASLLITGLALGPMLEKVPGPYNPTELVNASMLYVILFALIARFTMQSLSTLDLQSLQALPIRRDTLVNYLLIKPLFNPVNYLTLLLAIPFAIRSTAVYYDGATAFRFVLGAIFIIWFDSLTAAFLKRAFGSNIFSLIILLAIAGGLIALEYFKLFSLGEVSEAIFTTALQHPLGWLVPLAAVGFAYLLNRWFFARNYYIESFNKKKEEIRLTQLSFLDRFGIIGDLIGLEIKLILRHKRTKSILYLSFFFLFYGLLFYRDPKMATNYGMLFFAATFVTGLLMLMFGQWVISWDGSYFDSLMTKNIPVQSYIEANYYLLASFCTACFILTTPYFFFGSRILYLHLAALLFNLGVNIFFLVFFATYNTKRIDLSKSSAMNYQGTTIKNFLIMLPMLFFPWIVVQLLATFFNPAVALGTVGSIGLLGILFHRQLIQLCVNQFNRRKYALAQGFRESE